MAVDQHDDRHRGKPPRAGREQLHQTGADTIASACGFLVPDTLFTNDPERIRAFAARHGPVIYKAAGAGAPSPGCST